MNPNQAWAPWPRRAADVTLTERHVFLDVRGIALVNQRGFAKAVFPFAVLVLKQVALALATAENLAGAGDFEPLGNGFSGFGNACVFGHKGAKARWETPGCKRKNELMRWNAHSFVIWCKNRGVFNSIKVAARTMPPFVSEKK